MRWIGVLAMVAALGLVAAGCGSNSDSAAETEATTTEAFTEQTTTEETSTDDGH